MKICPTCNTPLEDDAVFCRNCGARVSGQPGDAPASPFEGTYLPPSGEPVPEPFDHTAEFEKEDISANKLISMLVYLLGIAGIVVALLAGGKESDYAWFHIRQGMKFAIAEVLLILIAAVLCWTVIVPIAAAIGYVVLLVIRVVCFARVCAGKAVEPAIIRSLPFLK